MKQLLIWLLFAILFFGSMFVFIGCATPKNDYIEFTVSTCPPYCNNYYNDYSHCDEISEDEQGNKICTTYGRWP